MASKRLLKIGHWWLKNKERKVDFRFVERIFLAAINLTGSAEGALVPVLLRITHWTKSGLPVSPPGLFPPWTARFTARPFSALLPTIRVHPELDGRTLDIVHSLNESYLDWTVRSKRSRENIYYSNATQILFAVKLRCLIFSK